MLPLLVALILAQQADQKPHWQPGWPCTGKEPSFDPVYLRTAEATGGQLFLFDRSEAGRSLVLMTADLKHKVTVARAVGTLEKQYEDIRIPVDSSIESLLIAATLQCMTRITIYDPAVNEVKPENDHYFRAGRVAIIPDPKPGVWTVRMEGAAHYSLSVQARTRFTLDADFAADHTVSLTTSAPAPRFKLIDAAAHASQSLALTEDRPGHFAGLVTSGFPQFRIAIEGSDEQGYSYQRVFPNLIDSTPGRQVVPQ